MAKTRINCSDDDSCDRGGDSGVKKHFLPNYFTEKNIALLHALCHANQRQKKAILRDADKSLVRCICECALNLLRGGISVDHKEKNKLSKYKKILRNLVKSPAKKLKKKSKKIWLKKKRLIQQHGGGAFLSALIAPAIATFLSNILFSK